MRARGPLVPAGILGAVLLLAGCATAAQDATSGDHRVSIVASTDVYGDIAAAVAGDAADVESIIVGAAQDPHSYEATAQDQLTLSRADLVIANGGGYDPFIETMLDASGTPDVVVVTAVDESGLLPGDDHDDGHADEHAEEEHAEDGRAEDEHGHDGHDHIEGFNEHVWYSLHAVEHIAEAIARELSALDERNADTYSANLDAFVTELAGLEEIAHEIHDAAEGNAVMVTEPVAEHLLAELGLDNVTPEEFVEAVEEGSDVSPTVLKQTLDRIADGSVALLAHNEQTTDPVTERVREAAEKAGVPVVSLTETLPDGTRYVEWMGLNLDALRSALGT